MTVAPGSLPSAVLASPCPAPARHRAGGGARRAARRAALNRPGVLVALFALFPVLWMISTAFKPPAEIFSLTPHPIPLHPTLANFHNVFSGRCRHLVLELPQQQPARHARSRWSLSSLVALLAAVALAGSGSGSAPRYLIMLLMVQMLPQQALVVSLFIDFSGAQPARQPVGADPALHRVRAADLDLDAAQLRGRPCRGRWRRRRRSTGPGPGPGSSGASCCRWCRPAWSPPACSRSSSPATSSCSRSPSWHRHPGEVHPADLRHVLHGQHTSDWGAIMAASTLYTIPPILFFLLVQRRMARGLVAGRGEGMTAPLPRRPVARPASPTRSSSRRSPAVPLRAGCCGRWKTVLPALRSSARTWPGRSSCPR